MLSFLHRCGTPISEIAREFKLDGSLAHRWDRFATIRSFSSNMTFKKRPPLSLGRFASELYEMIDSISKSADTSIRMVCDALEVPRSSYYHGRIPTASKLEDERLGNLMEEVFHEQLRRCGHRRIHRELLRRKIFCGQRKVSRLMGTCGFRALQPESFEPTTSDGRADAPAPNLLGVRGN